MKRGGGWVLENGGVLCRRALQGLSEGFHVIGSYSEPDSDDTTITAILVTV